MYPRNSASPEPIAIGPVVAIADGAVQTSGCTVRIFPKGGAEGDGAGTTAYSTDGIVLYTPTQAETNYTSFILIAKKASCIPASTTVVTSEASTAGQVVTDSASRTASKADVSALTNVTLAATTGLGNQTADITGSLSGSVGSVAGHTAQTGDSYAYLGTNLGAAGANATEAGGTGDQFTGLPEVTPTTASKTGYALTAGERTAIVDEWESQSQADPTGFHVNVLEVGGSSQTAGDFLGVWTPTKAGYLTGAVALEATLTAIKGAGWTTETLAAIDVLIDAIKAKTDGLNFTGDDVKATLDGEEVVTDTASRTASKADVSALTNVTLAATTGLGNQTADITGTVSTVTNLTNAPTNGDLTATMKASVTAAVPTAAAVLAELGTGTWATAIPWNTAWDAEVQSEVQDAIVVNHLDHLLAVDYDPASKPGVSTALLNELVGDDAGVSQFTANALELAPSGSGATAEEVRIEMDSNSTQLAAIVEDTGTTLPGLIDGLTGEDAYTGTLTVDDGAGTVLEGAVVNARRGGVLKASGTTDASGEITDWVFGAYTYDLSVRLDGYQPATDTIAVSADAWTKTISLTAIAVTASEPDMCTGYGSVYDEDGALEPDAIIYCKIVTWDSTINAGYSFDRATRSTTSDANGLYQFTNMFQGATYAVWRGNGDPVNSVIGTESTQELTSFMGAE